MPELQDEMAVSNTIDYNYRALADAVVTKAIKDAFNPNEPYYMVDLFNFLKTTSWPERAGLSADKLKKSIREHFGEFTDGKWKKI